ncbi:uncharacterized protein [Physcomitrium patens]|uniref:Uncharacterized protein n=1 Tax=Physcomitrium patens TaxID=3218 RepID=A0A2K1KKQ2_PHYPA|nr:hypothetical protein PHYPA_008029 [Physcomitrium patens]
MNETNDSATEQSRRTHADKTTNAMNSASESKLHCYVFSSREADFELQLRSGSAGDGVPLSLSPNLLLGTTGSCRKSWKAGEEPFLGLSLGSCVLHLEGKVKRISRVHALVSNWNRKCTGMI